MRQTFINTLAKLTEQDEKIYLLTGDLGFSVFENFAKKFPKRFINCGVAEQNMMGVAAGLALSGKKPYVYSIIPFVTIRCLEQIRNDVCYPNLNVKIIGAGGGFSYGHLGATHHAIEELGILRILPNMVVLSPGDPIETKKLMLESYKMSMPTYIRLAKSGDKNIHNKNDKVEIGKPCVLKRGANGTLLVTGTLLGTANELVEKLKEKNYNFTLISLPTIKPIDKKSLLKELKKEKAIFTLEEHNVIGGFGSAISEILLEAGYHGMFQKIGVPDRYSSRVGNMEYLRREFKLDKNNLIKTILKTYEKIE